MLKITTAATKDANNKKKDINMKTNSKNNNTTSK